MDLHSACGSDHIGKHHAHHTHYMALSILLPPNDLLFSIDQRCYLGSHGDGDSEREKARWSRTKSLKIRTSKVSS